MLDAVDGSVSPEDMTVNTIAERYLFRRGRDPDGGTRALFSALGIRMNCRFMYETTLESIKNIRLGKMTFAAGDDAESKRISRLVESKAGISVEKGTLPVGLKGYKAFHKKMGEAFGIGDVAEEVCLRGERRYLSEIGRLRKRTEGKRAIIEDRFTADIDWLLELLSDLGIEVIKIGMGPRHEWKEHPESRYGEMGIPFAENYSIGDLNSDIRELEPTLFSRTAASRSRCQATGYIRRMWASRAYWNWTEARQSHVRACDRGWRRTHDDISRRFHRGLMAVESLRTAVPCSTARGCRAIPYAISRCYSKAAG